LQNSILSHQITYKEAIEESAEDLYEHAPCGYLSCLPDGTIVKINHTLLSWIGFQREEVLYLKKFQDLVSIGGKIFYETHQRPLISMQGFVKEINYEMQRKNCSSFPTLINCVQVLDKQANPLIYRTTVFDITDRKKYERELLYAKKKAQEATKVKAQFLSTISHEIRTPMNGVIGLTNLLLEREPRIDQIEFLKVLKSSAGHLLNLVNDILDFSKIESGKIQLEEKPFNLYDLIHSIAYSLGIKAEEKGITLTAVIDPKVPSLLIADAVKVNQVITNLVANAVKFTQQGSVTIDLSLKEQSERMVTIEFSVRDTGIGIPKEKQEQIFEEFSQGSSEIQHKYGGTGLGLTISRKLLDLYGSKLNVKSEVGKGAVFTFTLKLKVHKEDTLEKHLTEDAFTRSNALQGVRLLIAEDNDINVLVLGQFLTQWGVDYERVENGLQAIEKVKEKDFDLILMDLQMPTMDGYQASSQIRRLGGEKYTTLPIIALTAFSKSEIQDSISQAGITAVISKPFDPTELFSTIVSYKVKKETTAPLLLYRHVTDSQSEAVQSNQAAICLKPFRQLTLNNPKEFTHLLELSIRDLSHFKNEAIHSLQNRNKDQLEKLAHKNKTVLALLEATTLEALVQKAKLLIQQDDESRIQQLMLELNTEIELILRELQQGIVFENG
jgi:PAS domain S-box-containing protein